MIDKVEAKKGYINIKTDNTGNVLSITPFFTKNTYYKIVDKVGGLSLKLPSSSTSQTTWNNLKLSSNISLLDTNDKAVIGPNFNNISFAAIIKDSNNVNNNDEIIANVLTDKAGLYDTSGISNSDFSGISGSKI